MALSSWLTGLAGAALGAAILCNLPTRLWMPAERATLKYLADTSLRTLDGKREFKEAQELSSLKPQLNAAGFQLYAVVFQRTGVDQFRPFFDGDIFLDEQRRFYGPRERWMFLTGVVRPSVWSNIFRARGKGIDGDLEGEGRLLGGVFVVGAGDSGVLLEHRESEWGDHANYTEILEVATSAAASKKNKL